MTARSTRARILVVDDDPGILRAVERVLSAQHDVMSCADPIRAPELAADFLPDIAICDIRMPGMDGFELLDRLRATSPDVDVILMTGSMTDTDALLVRALKQRAFYFILKPFRREALEALIERCTEMRRLRASEQAHLARVQRELTEAQALQRTMLPENAASIGDLRIRARCIACSELGGDFYDYRDIGGDRVAVIIADVRGHGVAAALLTATVKTAFRSEPRETFDPVRVIRRLVKALSAFPDDRFASVICGVIDRAASKFRYVNAGHPPMIYCTNVAAPRELGGGGPLACTAFPNDSWAIESVDMNAGVHLLAYTDGLIEQRGIDGQFGRPKLLQLFEGARRDGAIDAIIGEFDAFRAGRPLNDDVTLLHVWRE